MTTNDELRTRTRERGELLAELAHPLWLPRLLRRAGAWEWLLPWPLGYLQFAYRRVRFQETFGEWKASAARVHDNAWQTVAILVWVLVAQRIHLDVFEKAYAGDCAKVLFSGAFLIGTILSVSVALPGQAVAKLVLGRSPSFALNFVLPMAWGFVCGLAGAIGMMFFPALKWVVPGSDAFTWGLRALATYVALYGALMELNAILHMVRQYLAGMFMWSQDLEDREAKEVAAAAKAAEANAVERDALAETKRDTVSRI